ncbi:hypothetical protein B566_EDAN005209 [Ephemera danica]|nr:hypothetical protein B566_EDAN005209 [Ephemera danica]
MTMGDQAAYPDNEKPKLFNTALMDCLQKVTFGVDVAESHELCCTEVLIDCGPGTHTSGSSNVKLRNIVDFSWELKNYPGQLIAVHNQGNFFAYGLKGMNKAVDSSSPTGMIRVVSRDTGQRSLIRGIQGMVQDLAFSHLYEEVVLASVDEQGVLMVHHIQENPPGAPKSIVCTLLLHIERDKPPPPNEVHRIVWCPYIPDEGVIPTINSEVGLLLVYTEGCHAELLSVPMLNKVYRPGPTKSSQIKGAGFLQLPATDTVITDADFSPDGTALALATAGGLIVFFQTINFQPSPTVLSPGMIPGHQRCILKAALDLSSRYVVISDLYHRMLYILHLELDKGPVFVSVVSGFTLPQPAISFGIFDTRLHLPRTLHDRPDGEDDGETEFESFGIEENENTASTVVLNMVVVQPKSLQECKVAFKLNPKPPTLSNETLVFNETPAIASTNGDASSSEINISTAAAAADLPTNLVPTAVSTPKTSATEGLNTSNSAMNNSGSLNLMTPDAFSSPARHEDSPSRGSNVSSSAGSAKRITHTPPAPQSVPAPSELQQGLIPESVCDLEPECMVRDGAMASGGSSPSREVQQILAAETSAAEERKEMVETNSTYDWPQIPILLPMDAPQTQKEPMVPQPCAPVIVPNKEFVLELQSVRECLQTLTLLIDQQQNEIKELRSEVNRAAPQKEIQEALVSSVVERVLVRHLQRQSQAVDKQLRDKLNELRDSLASAFTKSVDSIVTARLGQGFKSEVQTQLVPVLLNIVQPIHQLIHTELTKKLAATDHLLQESISRLATSKTVQDSIATSVASALQVSMSNCFREVVFNSVVPSFERICHSMFKQLEDTFARGTQEQLNAVEAQCEKQRLRQVEKSKDVSQQINALSESVRLGHDSTANMVRSEINAAIAKSVLGLQEAVTRSSRDAVTETIVKTLKDMPMHPLPSRSATPQPLRTDPQTLLASVMGLVNQGQLNNAFQMALSASDLSVVVSLCERVNPQQVLSQTPCPLHQPVLLSLIQQLSADLTTHTELKLK